MTSNKLKQFKETCLNRERDRQLREDKFDIRHKELTKEQSKHGDCYLPKSRFWSGWCCPVCNTKLKRVRNNRWYDIFYCESCGYEYAYEDSPSLSSPY